MNDNQLFTLIRSIIIPGIQTMFPAMEFEVVKNFQQTQQGLTSKNGIFLHTLSDRRHGSPHKSDKWDQDREIIVHTETQIMLTTFQVNALAVPRPADPVSLTSKDIVNSVAAILQSDGCIDALRAQCVSIFRISDITNTYMLDDKDQFENSPSFDFTLGHQQVIITETPTATTVELSIHRV